MPSTYAADNESPRARVTVWPPPTMIADRIGIIGYEHGNRLSTMPATKYSATIEKKPLPSSSVCA